MPYHMQNGVCHLGAQLRVGAVHNATHTVRPCLCMRLALQLLEGMWSKATQCVRPVPATLLEGTQCFVCSNFFLVRI